MNGGNSYNIYNLKENECIDIGNHDCKFLCNICNDNSNDTHKATIYDGGISYSDIYKSNIENLYVNWHQNYHYFYSAFRPAIIKIER